jgi:beta-glucosidase
VRDSKILFSVQVKNTGQFNAEEVVQAYVHYPQVDGMPLKELKGFQRVAVKINRQGVATFEIPVAELQKWDAATNAWKLYPGEYRIVVGGHSADERLSALLRF